MSIFPDYPEIAPSINMASSSSLIERLEEELECSVCLNTYTDPKTLPCLHTFCCHCLNQLAERRVNREPIACPDCRTEINLPQGSNFDSFPSSFYLNRLRDIVAVQHQGHQVVCGSCDKKDAAIAFCFGCECFICAECRDTHSRLKIMKGHRMTALSEIQDTDIQEILRRPQLCLEPHHTNEVLEYFCKPCQRCICQKCAIMTHKNHEFVHLDEAAVSAKSRLEENKQKVQDRIGACKEQLGEDQQTSKKIEEQIQAAQQAIQHNTQRFIELAKRHEREMLTQLGKIQHGLEKKSQDHKEDLELRLGQLSSVSDYLDGVLSRGISIEILQATQSVLDRAQELLVNASTDLRPLANVYVTYKTNEDAYRLQDQLVMGQVTVVSADGRRPRGYKQVASFGSVGSGTGQFLYTAGIAVSSTGEIAVSDLNNHRVQFFSAVGQYRREFGNVGTADGELQHPRGIAYDKAGNIVVADHDNSRIQVFNPTGRWISTFGQRVLKEPYGVSVTGDDNIVVCDVKAKQVNVFSPRGVLLLQFGASPGTPAQDSSAPRFAIFHENKFFVGVDSHVVRVFDSRGHYLRDIGQMGRFNDPRGLAVDANNLLLVCDRNNDRVQVVTLQGEFVTSFGSRGSGPGQFNKPKGITVSPDGHVFVTDDFNHRVQVFKPQY